jgi:CelD/BcsL family acetyltransferase involved in cellulose biosynthesis
MSLTAVASLKAKVISSFDDPAVALSRWNHLLARGHNDSVNLTCEWQRNWWTTFGRGQLLLVIIEQDGEPICIAPLFAEHGMVCNICPEDRLDLIGGANRPDTIEAIIRSLYDWVPDFRGLRLYFIPHAAPTSKCIEQAAEQLDLECFEEASLAAPQLDIADQPAVAASCTRKKSLMRHENYFRRNGRLEVKHARTADDILPQLDEFFEQHIGRRAATRHPSLFLDSRQRDYYRSVVSNIGPTGWLRFTRLSWNGRAIAFHFGLCYRRRFLFGIPSFVIGLQHYSPGEVLLRQLIMAAIEEDATVFDFGPGAEAYKYRFATSEARLVTWGLYPKKSPYLSGAPR